MPSTNSMGGISAAQNLVFAGTRLNKLDQVADEETLGKILSRYGELRNIDLEYDKATDNGTKIAFVTFADYKEVQRVVKEFGGYFFRNGEAPISLPMDGTAPAMTASVSAASDSASTRAAIPDLITDSVIHSTGTAERVDTSVDLIDPSPPPLPSTAHSPLEVGYVYSRSLLMSLRSPTSF
ncbi:hypothetical protein AAVH_29909 [Aphelenchoides avenae]|nr:hypothetical protein AAVH_29909 [Aphelenchus avenae]